jgi:ketosteroid isomerase-like protein
MPPRPAWIGALFKAIDAKDADRFAAFIAEEGVFQFGNAPPVTGRGAIRDAVAAFFASIRALAHDVRDVDTGGERVWSRGTVTYTRHDGSQLSVPFCNCFEMRGELVRHYQIYVDASALYG